MRGHSHVSGTGAGHAKGARSVTRSDPQPGPTLVDDEPEYEIERILQQRTRRGRGRGRNQINEFLVKWTGYLRPEWTPAKNLEDTMALDEWETRQRLEKPTASTAKIFSFMQQREERGADVMDCL